MIQKKYVYEYEMKVRDYECDPQGIVNNANYQHYLEVARHEFFEAKSLNFYQLHLQGIDPVVAKIEIRYKKSLHASDRFKCCLNIEKKGLSYIFHQDILKLPEETLSARAKVEVVTLVDGKLQNSDVMDHAILDIIDDIKK